MQTTIDRIAERHAYEADARIRSLTKSDAWVVQHDNGATAVLYCMRSDLTVTIHRDYYTHWAALTQ